MTWLLISAYLVTVSVECVLTVLNVRHQRRFGTQIPNDFVGHIEPTTLNKMTSYNADRASFGLARTLYSAVIVISFLFAGGLDAYDNWVSAFVSGRLSRGVVFFLGLQLGLTVLELPFELFSVFRIEQRHGFNRMSLGLFFADWVKGLAVSSVLLAVVSSAGFALYFAFPTWYWLGFWAFGVVLGIVLTLLAPYVIEPLFIKTTPLQNEALVVAVQELAKRVGVQVRQVLQVDASRRSSHSNAYFTGIGRVKRVVLFDTLLERLNEAELLAVLGHELGHWKLRHITQRLLTTAGVALVAFYVASRWLAWDETATWMGVSSPSIAAKVVFLAFLGEIVGTFITPISALWSRRHEWQADAFATSLLGQSRTLGTALVKLAEDNLANLHPHPWYAAFYYSHPPTVERVRRLLRSSIP